MNRKVIIVVGLCVSLLGIVWFSKGAYIQVKALLAQQLLQTAWQQTLEGQSKVRPWSWADTWPLARLTVPARNVDLIILEGASGNSLAFAPGHLQGTSAPGDIGFSVISAHRDTHFSFLRHIKGGDIMRLQVSNGDIREYEVTAMEIVDERIAGIPAHSSGRGIMLVTCYPFDSLRAGGSLRYIVYAIEKDKSLRQDDAMDV